MKNKTTYHTALLFFVALACTPLFFAPPAWATGFIPTQLRCEYRENPLGIDVASPRLGWILQSLSPSTRGQRQTAYQILAASAPTLLAHDQGNLWNSGIVASSKMNGISYAGKRMKSGQSCWWKIRAVDQAGHPSVWSAPAHWTMGMLAAADWQGAQWIAAPGATDGPQDFHGPKAKYETLLLRRRFSVKPKLVRALAFVCGLGQYAMTLNGVKVGDALLTPGWTGYDKTCLYDTYDVTSALHPGGNTAGLFLGNGFFHSHGGRYTKVTGSFGSIQAIGLLRLEYADGSIQNVITDDHWKAASGPITFSSIYGGEDYDARLISQGWDRPGFSDAAWATPAVLHGPGGILRGLSAAGPDIRSMGVLTPIAQTAVGPTATVYDLGQNASLMAGFQVLGPAGSSVKITPSELVRDNGDINDTMCDGNSYWTYTLNGQGIESYFSKFYYRGGRYLKVELQPAAPGGALPKLVSLKGTVIRADAPAVGHFSCSNTVYNKTYDLVRWAQKNNMLSVMTDCPTREKLGWLEEDHLNGPALRYNFDLATLMGKMVGDMTDAQRDNGLVPSLVPNYYHWDEGKYTTPIEWGSSCILVSWQQYQFDGDADLLRLHYDSMKRYIGYLDHRANGHIIDFGLGDWYDNHSEGEPSLTPVGLTDTAFYYNDYQVMARIAAVLGKDEDAAAFAQNSEQIRQAFNQKFYNPATGDYAKGAQGSNCLPLAMGLADPANRPTLLAHLVADLQSKGTTAGEVSFEYLLKALADGRRSDLIYSTYEATDQGYGLQVKEGKTSLTEGWNGGASQDHFMFGQINEWLYRSLAGIQDDPDGPGFTKIIIRPTLVGDLTHAEATYNSRQGLISSAWTHTPSGLTLRVVIPIGATATVYVPAANPKVVTESGRAAASARGVTFLRAEPGTAVYAVGSGSYSFASVDAAVAPTGLSAQSASGKAILTWNASANATRYTISRTTDSGADFILAKISAALTFTDTGLTNGVTYHYTVTAANSAGQGAGATANATPSLIVNPGFETPSVAGFAYAPAGSGWTFTPLSGNSGSGLTGNGSGFTGANPSAVPEGRQAAFLQGAGTISQILSGLTPGASYTLTFSAAQRVSSSHGGQTWQVRLDNTIIGDYAPLESATTYTDYTASFTATAPSQTLSFVGTHTRGEDNTVFIDSVRIRAGK